MRSIKCKCGKTHQVFRVLDQEVFVENSQVYMAYYDPGARQHGVLIDFFFKLEALAVKHGMLEEE